MSAQGGPIFSKPLAARGMAIGDFANDGALDVLVAGQQRRTSPVAQQRRREHHWLGVRLVGKKANMDENSHAAASLRTRDRQFGEPPGLQLVLGPEETTVWRK